MLNFFLNQKEGCQNGGGVAVGVAIGTDVEE
jgi:hypothetical protein